MPSSPGPKATSAIVLVVWLLQAASPLARVRAEPDAVEAPEPADYRALLSAALDEYESAHFAESQALMLRAHALFPNARTLRGLGMVSFELREYAESVRYFEAALANRQRPLTPELRSETEQLCARARAFTGRLNVSATPATAQLALDGAPLSAGDIVVSVGEHTLTGTAPGFVREQRKVVLRGGDVQSVHLPLLAEPSRTSGLAAPAAPRESDVRARRWLWASIGAAIVAGAATGLAIALARREPGTEPAYTGTSGERPLKGPAP